MSVSKKPIRKIRNKNYSEVIEVNAPIRFYWDKKKRYDGIEIGPIKLTKSQSKLAAELAERQIRMKKK